MDPNANLQQQERIIADRTRPDGTLHNYDRYALHGLRMELRAWLDRGGFEPNWDQAPNARQYYGR